MAKAFGEEEKEQIVIMAVAVGTRGYVAPLAELGEEMIKRGHEFRILTHEAFRPLVEAKGVIYKKLDTDADHVMQYLVTDYKTSMDFMKGMFRLKKENSAFMEQTLDAVAGSDLVMYGTCSAFAYHAAEYLHIPCARLFYSPMDPTGQYSLYSDEYNSDRVLKSYGGLRTGMNLMTMLAMLQMRMLQALKETGIRAVVQADRIPESERVNTDRLYFIGAVPYPYIFDRVRAVVHHGGNTTNGMGLRAGLPTLVIPLALDQYFYGRMDHRIGAGPKPLYIRKKLCSTEEIKEALRELVSGKYDRGAAEAGEKIKKENGVEIAADAIEEYILQA